MTKIFTEEENQAWSKALSGKMTSACVAIRSSGKVLMVKASYKDHWTFPSGIVDERESPKSAALRETSEEVGLLISDDDCDLLTVVYTASNGKDRDRFNFAFVTDIVDMDVKLSVPNDEIEKAEWVDFSEVAERSGNKGSYIKFQMLLLDASSIKPYTEIHPSA
jgi:8-oxo-dGTP pyrophosphatase MutT (NUDIX family)